MCLLTNKPTHLVHRLIESYFDDLARHHMLGECFRHRALEGDGHVLGAACVEMAHMRRELQHGILRPLEAHAVSLAVIGQCEG